MTQMYRVKFTRNGEGTVESGEAILNAADQNQAISIVCNECHLPVTGTQFDVTRVKPSFVLIRRANVARQIATFEATTVSEYLASNATFPRSDRPEREIFAVTVAAELHADGELDAISGVARAIIRHADGARQRLSLREFDISCEPVKAEPRVSRFEENANYDVHHFVQGGSVRPK